MPYYKYRSKRKRGKMGRHLSSYRKYKKYKRSKKRRVLTNKQLTKTLRSLTKKVSDRKFFYLEEAVTPVWNNGDFTPLCGGNALNACPPSGTTGLLPYNCREVDSASCNLKNIKISINLTKLVNNSDRNRYCPYWIGLVKTTNQIGSVAGIAMPRLDDIFDPNALTTGLLSNVNRWDTYRTMEGPGSENLKSTKILWSTQGVLQSPGMLQPVSLDTATATAPGGGTTGTIQNDPGVTAPENCNFQATYPSHVTIRHTHKCKNAVVKFDTVASGEPINNKYFLVALAKGSGANNRDLYVCSSSIKTSYYDC